MRRKSIYDSVEGLRLTRPILNEHGVELARIGSIINENHIRKLASQGIYHIFVEEEGFEGIEYSEPLEPKSYVSLKVFLKDLTIQLKESRKNQRIRLPIYKAQQWGEMICHDLGKVSKEFLLYSITGNPGEKWVNGVINRAVLAAWTILRIGGIQQATNLASAALIMDLGIWLLPSDELIDQALAGEYEDSAVKEHVINSMNLVASSGGINSIVKAIVAQHHEKCDGSGFPAGRKREEIHPLARVMGVVDTYLTLTHVQQRFLPHESLEWLMAAVGVEYDHLAVRAFCNSAPVYPIGTEVVLDSGEEGVVSKITGPVLSRPCVRVLVKDGQKVSPYEVDLTAEKTKSIVAIKL
jgi:hypothetical protein